MPDKLKECALMNNKQNGKSVNGVKQSPDPSKQRVGTAPGQPSNADYDYRPDFGETGGGVEHNPELKTDTVQNPAHKPVEKLKEAK